MRSTLVIGTAVAALGLAGPAWAGSPLDEYQQSGHITPCRYSESQLQGSVPNDVAQYAPEYASQLQAAARERANGCGAAAASGSTGRGAGPGGGSGGSGGSNAATGAGAAAPAVVAAARRARAQARARRRARAQAHLAAVTLPAVQMPQDTRVPDRALFLAALPILLLLGLVGAFRIPAFARRRRAAASTPVRTPAGAIVLPPPAPLAGGDGNGARAGNGSAHNGAAEAPTEEVDALEPDPERASPRA